MKKIVIIGGGISGLSAGIYAIKNGYNPIILEKNPVAGGLCTSWYRQGMHLDGCIHWLTGTNPNSAIYRQWQEVHAFSSQDELLYLPSWGSYKYQGVTVTFWRDLDRAEKEWSEISPRDKKQIHRFFKLVKKIMSVDLPLDAPAFLLPLKLKLVFGLQLLKVLPSYLKSMVTSCEKYARKFKHPALRWAINHAQPGAGNLYSMVYSYSTIAGNNGGIPVGGSDTLTKNMLNYYLSIGGTIKYNSEVISINTDKKKKVVESLTLKNGDKIDGDYYISCCDSNYVLINLLGNEYAHPKMAERFNKPSVHPAPSCVLLNYEIPSDIIINNPTNFVIDGFKLGGKIIDHINMRSFNYDESFVKNGKTTLQVLLDQDSDDFIYWQELRKDMKKYQEFKKNLAQKVQELIEEDNPAFKGNMKILDVATPITFYRYVNASRGTYMSFLFNVKKGVLTTRGHIGGLRNFMLSGQYVQTPGGLPLAMASGKFSIDWIKNEELPFFTRAINLFKN